MTQTQPQPQSSSEPARELDPEAETQVRAGDGTGPAHPTPPTYQQIEAFGYQRFTNREQSRLDFGARLLDLAEDDGLPLLERAKFLAIFS
jgi:polyphosphate kinase